ncbi:MAG: type II toxin-antitoxin system Phd/YefM family antitoxin [Leucobacter sp.]
MPIHQVNVYEAKTQLSRLIDSVLSGDEVIIAKAGKPMVRLVRWEPVVTRTPGVWRGQVRIADDFDELSEQDQAEWYGE